MPDNQTSGSKSRLLFLLRYLQENTDDNQAIERRKKLPQMEARVT